MASKREGKTKIAESLNYRVTDFQRAEIQRALPTKKSEEECPAAIPHLDALSPATRAEKTAKDQPRARCPLTPTGLILQRICSRVWKNIKLCLLG